MRTLPCLSRLRAVGCLKLTGRRLYHFSCNSVEGLATDEGDKGVASRSADDDDDTGLGGLVDSSVCCEVDAEVNSPL